MTWLSSADRAAAAGDRAGPGGPSGPQHAQDFGAVGFELLGADAADAGQLVQGVTMGQRLLGEADPLLRLPGQGPSACDLDQGADELGAVNSWLR